MPPSPREVTDPQPGDRLRYEHPTGYGYGEHHKGAAGFGEQTAEMTELDLKDGTEGVVLELDADTGWMLFQWVDGTGIDRITTIDPDNYQYFTQI